MTLDRAAHADDSNLSEESILLDALPTKIVLDIVGATTLFTAIALALDVSDGVLVTAMVGALVVASRLLRRRVPDEV